MRNDARIELIRNVWLFERCTNKELDEIAKLATPLDLPAGKVLATQGERGREFFAIVSGKVEATRDGTTIGTLGSGSFFGEMSLLESLPRVATVTTIEPTSVLVLNAQAFNSLVASMPSVDRNMLIVLAHRLRDVEDRYVNPTHDSSPPSSRSKPAPESFVAQARLMALPARRLRTSRDPSENAHPLTTTSAVP